MILRIMLLLEIMTVIVVLHSVNSKKIVFDIKTLVLILTHVVFLEIVNKYELSKGYTFIAYLLYIAYCVWKFKVSLLQAIKYTIFCVIQITILQFIWTLVLSITDLENNYLLGMWVNLLTLISCILIAVRRKRCRESVTLQKKDVMIYFAILFVALIVLAILFQSKSSNGIQAEMFIFAIVAIIFMLIFIEWYELYKTKCKELEKELETNSVFGVLYQDLINKVRIRQHNINNQIAAIMGTHYVSKTYEELVKSQEKYCGEIMKNNKFNSLLWIGNNVLAGFLYKKFMEIEQQGYNIIYKTSVQDLQLSIHMQYLIEVLGILLDNATEAVAQGDYNKTIKVNIYEEQDTYLFEIQNLYRYVPFDEIQEWFAFGESSKGKERGIGLYRVKEICKEQNIEICCSNIEEENVNWIKFVVRIKKQGNS